MGDAPASLWDDGWYRFARRVPSPNHGDRLAGVAVDLIVIHSISLPPGHYQGNAVQEFFCNRLDWEADSYYESIRGLTVSAHFYVRRSGELWQFVSCNRRAWHAGASSWEGRSNCNDFSVGIELEGLEGQSFEAEQYESLVALCAAIAQCYPVAHVVGHEDVAPGRKFDPGTGFDWRGFRASLGWRQSMFPRATRDAASR